MKKLLFLLAFVASVLTVTAQNGRTQILREGWAWNRTGEKGEISKIIWKNRTPTGVYDLTLSSGKVVTIAVLRGKRTANEPQTQIKFQKGYSSFTNYNWTDLPDRYAIWLYGDENPVWVASVDGYEYLQDAVAIDACGNLLDGVRRPSAPFHPDKIRIEEKRRCRTEKTKEENNFWSGQEQEEEQEEEEIDWDKIVKEYHLPTCYADVLEQYPSIYDVALRYMDRGKSSFKAFKKATKKVVRGWTNKQAALHCLTGKTWFGRNWPWVVGTAVAVGGGYILLKKDKDPSGGHSNNDDNDGNDDGNDGNVGGGHSNNG